MILFTPKAGEFSPSLVLMGVNLNDNGDVPHEVEVPENFGTMVFEGNKKALKEYEPFTPSSYYYTVKIGKKLEKSGEYFLALYDPNHLTGKVGLAIGYEEKYSLLEWVRVAYDTIRIHLWEGQRLLLILAPMIAIMLVGLGYLSFRVEKLLKLNNKNLRFSFALAGLFYLGSAGNKMLQMLLALYNTKLSSSAFLTIIFIALPIVLAYGLIKISSKDKKLKKKDKLKGLIYGILGIFFWAGLYIGPALALMGSILSFLRDSF